MRHVNVSSFNGPLDLLLQLIEQQQFDITQVSLAAVTEQYIAELQKMDELPVDELAEFLVVAAKLLVIKSRLLLPATDVTGDDASDDLERQLKMYRAFVEAAKHVVRLYNRHRVAYPRDGLGMLEPIFNPPEKLQSADLDAMFRQVLHDLEPIVKLPETVIIRTINMRQKIADIKELLLRQPKTNFHRLLRAAKTKTDVIITFLAVLELVKQRSVAVVQDEPHADMAIEALPDVVAEPLIAAAP